MKLNFLLTFLLISAFSTVVFAEDMLATEEQVQQYESQPQPEQQEQPEQQAEVRDSEAKTSEPQKTADEQGNQQVKEIDQESLKPEDFTNNAVLQGLNKVTAKTSELDIKIGQKVNFGNLEIALYKCWKSPPEDEPDNKALIGIWEEVPGEERKQIFYGWMFSSSISLSSLEHPIYDVTLVSCKK